MFQRLIWLFKTQGWNRKYYFNIFISFLSVPQFILLIYIIRISSLLTSISSSSSWLLQLPSNRDEVTSLFSSALWASCGHRQKELTPFAGHSRLQWLIRNCREMWTIPLSLNCFHWVMLLSHMFYFVLVCCPLYVSALEQQQCLLREDQSIFSSRGRISAAVLLSHF